MNPEIKAEWVAALRSGEYQQTRGHLSDSRGFCCLGVLCDIAVKQGVIPTPITSTAGVRSYGGSVYDRRTATLPDAVKEWAGLDNCDPGTGEISHPDPDYEGDEVCLSALNDHGRAFGFIADVIEEHL